MSGWVVSRIEDLTAKSTRYVGLEPPGRKEEVMFVRR